ncbi:MAG: DnaJ domain-containing protein [Bacteroidota bacterium]|jgi:DnaJ-class molecular chaperone
MSLFKETKTDSELLTLFGLALPTTRQALKTRYRRLAQECHPDHNPGDKNAEERFKALAAAYDDLNGRNTPFVDEETGEAGASTRTADGTPLEELGKGLPRNKNAKPCDSCSGKGYVTEAHPGQSATCPKCHGRAVIQEDTCQRCKGTGKYKHPNTGQVVGDCFGCKGTGIYKFQKPVPCDRCREEQRFDLWGMLYGNRQRRGEPSFISTGRIQTQVTTYMTCGHCKGTGEIELDNPVLPRNRIL